MQGLEWQCNQKRVMMTERRALQWHLLSQHSALTYTAWLWRLWQGDCDKAPGAAYLVTALFREGAILACLALIDSK